MEGLEPAPVLMQYRQFGRQLVTDDVLVVVPTLGQRPDWLADTLASLQCQQGIDIRIVVVAPTDELELPVGGPHTIEVIVEKRRGLSTAINSGLHSCAAEFCTWIGDDDLLSADAIRLAVEKLRATPGSPFIYGKTRYISADGKTIGITKPGKLAAKWLKYGKDFVPQPGSLIRTEAFKNVGGLDVKLKNAMDLDLFIRLSALGRPSYIPRELSCYRLHEDSITVSKGGTDEAEAVRRKFHGSVAKRTYLLWRPVVRVIDRLWDIANRRLPCAHVSPASQYRNVS
jgi:glycosyltransferase involved in cell wall biosynthesis